MPKDDMRVIMYKILRYLYECNRQDIDPCFEDMCHHCQLFKIPQSYWAQIMLELMEAGYIKGFAKLSTKDGVIIQMLDHPAITIKGVDYLEENSVMNRIKDQLGTGFEILLSTLVK